MKAALGSVNIMIDGDHYVNSILYIWLSINLMVLHNCYSAKRRMGHTFFI